MSDILDVMNIKEFPAKKGKETNKTDKQSQQQLNENRQIYTAEKFASNNQRRKLSALNTELYKLLGTNVPPMAIDTKSVTNLSNKKFKDKLLINDKKNLPWRYLGFKNSAREDDLILYHWTKSAPLKSKEEDLEKGESEEKVEGEEEEPKKEELKDSIMENDNNDEDGENGKTQPIRELDPNEYRYVKYNTKLDIPTFTETEYNEIIEEEEKELEKIELEKKMKKEAEDKRKEEEEEEEKKEKEELIAEKDSENKEESKVEELSKGEGNDVTDKTSENEESENRHASEESKEEGGKDKKDNIKKDEIEKGETEKKDTSESLSSSVTSSVKPGDEINNKENEDEKTDEVEKKARPWSYEETKFLFDLCLYFDMRWAIIFDRYLEKYEDRSVEDLKVQMYKISYKILEKRNNPNDAALIKSLKSFNKERELERKYYLSRLIHRAPTEIAEEESLVMEARKFELAAKKMFYERAQLLQLLDSPQSSASVNQYLTPQGITQLYNSLMTIDKGKKRKAEMPVAPLLGPNAIPHTQHIQMSNMMNQNKRHKSNSINSHNGGGNNNNNSTTSSNSNNATNNNNNNHSNNNGSTNVKSDKEGNNENKDNKDKENNKLNEIQKLLQKTLTEEDLQVYGIEIYKEKVQPGVHVRSQKIVTFKPSVQAKVVEILGQLGLTEKPTIPTGPVCKKFDKLLNKISHLVSLKKQSDKLTAEIELIKRQKGVN